jgi:hypothetical protein
MLETAPGNTGLRMFIHEIDKGPECIRANYRVCVQKEEITRRIDLLHRRPQDCIVPAGESEIRIHGRQRAPGAPAIVLDCFSNFGRRFVSTPIFAYSNSRPWHTPDFFRDRSQAGDREIRHTIIEDHDQELHRSLLPKSRTGQWQHVDLIEARAAAASSPLAN